MPTIKITPLDTLFFRDGKPFSQGDETWADGHFPPNPSVLYGALRTYIASKKNIPFSDIPNKLSNVKISDIFYQIKNNSFYYPTPLQMVELDKDSNTKKVEKKDKEYKQIVNLIPYETQNLKSSLTQDVKYIFVPPKNQIVESVEGSLMELNLLIDYLKGIEKDFKIRKIIDYMTTEPKVGNAINSETNTTEESMLYRVGMIRTKRSEKDDDELKICITAQNSSLTEDEIDNSLVKLGAEGKLVHFANIKSIDLIDTSAIKIKGNYFKLYLATPAIFDHNHWYPNLAKFGIDAKLIGTCMGKPKSIGGFKMISDKGREPKPMYKAVPAGSVFFYETNEPAHKIQNLQGCSVSDIATDEGFGIAYFGNFYTQKS